MDESIGAILRQRHGIITRQEALSAGMTGRQVEVRLARGEWVTEARGVYRHAVFRPTWHSRLLVACHEHRALASHCSAGVLHRFDDFRPGRIEVSVGSGLRRPQPSVRVHQSTQMDLADATVIDGIPTTGLLRAVLDIAAVVSRDRLEALLDHLIARRGYELPDLAGVLARHSRRGRDGCGRLRTVLEDRIGRTDVPLSQWSRWVSDLLVRHGLPEPTFEHPIVDRAGRTVAQVDLAYPERRVAIELDSVGFHLNRESFERDPMRRNAIVLAGWTVLCFTFRRYVADPVGLAAEVRAAIAGL